MKKILMILGVALFTAPALVNAAEVTTYGTINYMISNNDNSSGEAVMQAKDNGSKLGAKIKEATPFGTAFGQIEVAVDTDDTGSTPFDSKLAFAGMDFGALGKVSAGRQNSVFKTEVQSKTDLFPEYGARATQKLFSRDSHTVVYSNDFNGIKFDNLVKIDGSTGKNGIDVYESTIGFTVANVGIGLGMSENKVAEDSYYGIGFDVPISKSTSLAYSHTKKDPKSGANVTGNDYVIKHKIGPTTYTAGYGKIEDSTAYTTLGASRKISDNGSIYVAYENQNKTSGSTDVDGMSLGFKFNF